MPTSSSVAVVLSHRHHDLDVAVGRDVGAFRERGGSSRGVPSCFVYAANTSFWVSSRQATSTAGCSDIDRSRSSAARSSAKASTPSLLNSIILAWTSSCSMVAERIIVMSLRMMPVDDNEQRNEAPLRPPAGSASSESTCFEVTSCCQHVRTTRAFADHCRVDAFVPRLSNFAFRLSRDSTP